MAPLTLGEKQRLMTRLLPRLLDYIHAQGYECSLGEGYVGISVGPDETSPHLRQGGHFKKLAQDLDLMHRNPTTQQMEYLTHTADHRPFGEFWESLHPLCRWGGRFHDPPDGTHYSLEDGGVA